MSGHTLTCWNRVGHLGADPPLCCATISDAVAYLADELGALPGDFAGAEQAAKDLANATPAELARQGWSHVVHDDNPLFPVALTYWIDPLPAGEPCDVCTAEEDQ